MEHRMADDNHENHELMNEHEGIYVIIISKPVLKLLARFRPARFPQMSLSKK